jgi:hypothetical protein
MEDRLAIYCAARVEKNKIEAHQGSLVFLRVLFHRSFQFGHPPLGRGRHISP